MVNHLIDNINEQLSTKYIGLDIIKGFTQYVHTNMFLFHLAAHNGEKVTACINIYGIECELK